MRISDWSSDVCSSDLIDRVLTRKLRGRGGPEYAPVPLDGLVEGVAALIRADIGDRFSIRNPRWLAGGASKLQMAFDLEWSGKSGEGAVRTESMVLRMEPPAAIVETSRLQIGRASCSERVCQYV